MANDDNNDYEDIWPPPHDLELRDIALDPRPRPTAQVVLVIGAQRRDVQRVCQRFAVMFRLYYLDIAEYIVELCDDASQHDRRAYGYLHPTAFQERFVKQLHHQEYIHSADCSFFLLPILRYKIEREVAKGRKGFLIVGLEGLVRATQDFMTTIVRPVAVLCFGDAAAPGRRDARALIEQLFSSKRLFEVGVGVNLQATWSTLLTKTMMKHVHLELLKEHIGRRC